MKKKIIIILLLLPIFVFSKGEKTDIFKGKLSIPMPKNMYKKYKAKLNSNYSIIFDKNIRLINLKKLLSLYDTIIHNKELKEYKTYYSNGKFSKNTLINKDIDDLIDVTSIFTTLAKDNVDEGFFSLFYVPRDWAEQLPKNEISIFENYCNQSGYKGFSNPFNTECQQDIDTAFYTYVINMILKHYQQKEINEILLYDSEEVLINGTLTEELTVYAFYI